MESYNPIYATLFMAFCGLSSDRVIKSLSYLIEPTQEIDPTLLTADLLAKYEEFQIQIDSNTWLQLFHEGWLKLLPTDRVILMHTILAFSDLPIEAK